MGEKKVKVRIVSRQEQAASLRIAIQNTRAREKYLMSNPEVEPKPVEEVIVKPKISAEPTPGIGKYEVRVFNEKGEKVSGVHRSGRREAEVEVKGIKARMKNGWRAIIGWVDRSKHKPEVKEKVIEKGEKLPQNEG